MTTPTTTPTIGAADLPEPHFGEGRRLGLAFRSDAYSVAQVQALFASHEQSPSPQAAQQPAPSSAAAEPDMRAVVAVAVTMLYESHPDDVLRTFTIAELAEIVRITEAMGSEQVEAIYKRAWDALAVRITFHPAQADSQPAPSESQQPAPSPAPAGWKLVPVEPTEEMLKAADDGDDAYTLRCFGPDVRRVMQGPYDHYCAMLDAAPAPSAAPASKAVLAAIRAANMQLVRTGDDEFMLVTLKQATAQADTQPEPVLDEAIAIDRTRDLASNGGRWPSDWVEAYRRGYSDRAARAPADSVTAPAGGAVAGPEWKWVPVDATDDMVRATDKVNFENEDTDGTIHNVWNTMLSAAPTPPAQAADSMQEDAARYRYLRDGDWREHEKLESVIRLQLNALWDETIDAARKQGGVMLDDPKTIRMTNLTQSLKEGRWNIEYWRGYGFTANNRTTTNGSLSFLLRCVHTPENQAAVMQFAREIAKTDHDAARQIARIDAANAARRL